MEISSKNSVRLFFGNGKYGLDVAELSPEAAKPANPYLLGGRAWEAFTETFALDRELTEGGKGVTEHCRSSTVFEVVGNATPALGWARVAEAGR